MAAIGTSYPNYNYAVCFEATDVCADKTMCFFHFTNYYFETYYYSFGSGRFFCFSAITHIVAMTFVVTPSHQQQVKCIINGKTRQSQIFFAVFIQWFANECLWECVMRLLLCGTGIKYIYVCKYITIVVCCQSTVTSATYCCQTDEIITCENVELIFSFS